MDEVSVEAKRPWTEAEDKALRVYLEAGLSSSRMATALGTGRSRNAVIGRLHRMGLVSASRVPRRYTDEAKRKKPAVPTAAPRRMPALAALTGHKAPPKPIVLSEPPASGRVTITDLTPAMCKFPIGDPCKHDFKFCGGVMGERRPYCDFHADIAYEGHWRRDRKNAQAVDAKAGWKFQHMGGRSK